MPRWGNIADRFWPKLVKGDGCWLWSGPLDKDGYGKYGSKRRPHRVAYELANGPIPAGLYVCHSCDTRACCNPSHLFLGTNQENLADRDAKGRTARGERCGAAKLTQSQVNEIRQLGDTQRALAKRYGVSFQHVNRIVKGKAWI